MTEPTESIVSESASWSTLHLPTLEAALTIMRRNLEAGRAMGLKVGTLVEAIDDVESVRDAARSALAKAITL